MILDSNFAMTLNRVFRTVLLYLLMAILPFSGMAAAGMSCGKVHAASTEAGAHTPCDKASAASGNDQSTSTPDKASPSHASVSCSLCYLSFAAPMTSPPDLSAASSQAVFPREPGTFAEFIAPVLDRPPRQSDFFQLSRQD